MPQLNRLNTKKIVIKVSKNPKRARSASASRFRLYRSGMTVGQYVEAVEKKGFRPRIAHADLEWDRERGFIDLK